MYKFLMNFLMRRQARKIEREACTKIGVELHRQIRQAIAGNEKETGVRLQTFFTVGYLYSFVRIGFTTLGLNGGEATERHLKYICDGVFPEKLYEIFSRLLAALELAKSMDKNKIIPGSKITPSDAIKQFEIGMEAGAFDAGCFNPFSEKKAENLRKHLLGENLEYLPLPE